MARSIFEVMQDRTLCQPPKWLAHNLHYAVITGSVAYAVSNDTSDMDVVGFCIPKKEDVFPHLRGEILGFGNQIQRFDQWQQHHVMDKSANQEYDFTIYSIVKYFQLCMENNPNMLDTLFTPQRCVLFCSPVAQMVRDNRKLFLHKGSYHKFRGYAYSQLHKIGTKANSSNPKRQESIEKYGYDVKFAYHVVRLALEGEQILLEHDLDIQKNSEILKSIRRGEWSEQKLRDWFDQKENHLEELYVKSDLQTKPDEGKIKELLLNCLEHHYGSLDDAIKKEVPSEQLVAEIQAVLDKYK
jgi:predicted nucleotidyltransferase